MYVVGYPFEFELKIWVTFAETISFQNWAVFFGNFIELAEA